MVDCSDSFVPVAQGQLWPGGFCQGVVSAYPSTNSMQSQLCQVRNIVIIGCRLCATQFFLKIRQDKLERAKLIRAEMFLSIWPHALEV